MEELYRDDKRVVYVEQANADGIVVPVYRAFEIRDGLEYPVDLQLESEEQALQWGSTGTA